MSGDHVIPIFILRPRAGPGLDPHSCRSWIGTLHIINYLVSQASSAKRISSPSFRILNFCTRQFCLRHPDVRDICDIGQYLFWDSQLAWYLTAAMFILNNTFIQVNKTKPPLSAEIDIGISSSRVCTV